MTLDHFRKITKDMPGDATLKAFDPEVGNVIAVTGIVSGYDVEGAYFEIEFHTDEP